MIHNLDIDMKEKKVVLPISKKLIKAVGLEEDELYIARFEDGLLIIGESADDICEKAYTQGKKVGSDQGYDRGYASGYEQGYENGLQDGLSEGNVSGYRRGYDDATEGNGYHETHVNDCGLDCDYDCENCRFNGD